MATKTISLSEDAYDALVALKKPGESFSDTVKRLTRRRSLTDLCGLLDAKAAAAVGDAIDANRQDRAKARRRELGL